MDYVRDFLKKYFLIFLIMSMSDSDLWASQVINELIEEISTIDRNKETVGSLWQSCMTDDELTHQESEIEHIEEETRTCRDYITGSPCKLENESSLSISTNDVSITKDALSGESLEFKISDDNSHFIFSAVAETNSVNVVKTMSSEVENPLDTFDADSLKSSEDNVVEDSILINTKDELTDLDVYRHSNPFLTNTSDIKNVRSKDEEGSNKKTNEKYAFLTVGLESEPGSSAEYLKRIDDKVHNLGFKSQQGENGVPDRTSSLTGLYFKYFTENYIKEEMDYRWRFQNKSRSDTQTNTQVNSLSAVSKKSEFKALQEENTEGNQRKGEGIAELDENIEIINQEMEMKSINSELRPLKRKNRNILEEIDVEFDNFYSESGHRSLKNTGNSTEYSLNNRPENIFLAESDGNLKNISRKKRTAKSCAPERNNCLLPREIFSPRFLRRKRRKLRHDEEDDLVKTKRIDKIITTYRTTCRVFEELFLRPSATIIAESIEFLLFLFFLGICGLCIIYKGTTFSSLKRNKDSFVNMFKKGNRKIKSSFSKLYLSTKTLGFQTETNKNSFKNETPLVGFSPKPHTNDDTSGNKIQLNVEPDDVLVLNSVFEEVKQGLEDMYEKGDNYIESLTGEPRIAVAESPDDDFVDIILKECVKVLKESHSSGNELDMGVVLSSKATCCTEHGSNESVANKFCNSSQTWTNSSCKGKESHCIKLRKRTISDESLLKEFNIDSDREKGFVLNSTVNDDSEFPTRARTRNRSRFRLLSPSDKGRSESVSAISSTPTSSCKKSYSTSSMSVNVPSFRSRSELNLTLDSSYLLDDPEEEVSTENFCTEDLREPYITDAQAARPAVIPKKYSEVVGATYNSTASRDTSIMTLPEQQRSASTENCVNQSLEKLHDSFPVESNFSEDPSTFENAGTDDLHTCSLRCGNNFSFDNPDHLPDLSTVDTSNDDMDSLVMLESPAICDDRSSKGKKNRVNLRRRMSLILENWRNNNMMQCVTSNLKGRKKYKKQLNILEN